MRTRPAGPRRRQTGGDAGLDGTTDGARADGAVAGRTAAPAAPTAANEMREKSTADSSAAARLGTGHGQREWSVSRRTAFERASTTPDQLLQLEYDSVERLVAAGVIPSPYAGGRPRPFPSSPTAYVPDPPRW